MTPGPANARASPTSELVPDLAHMGTGPLAGLVGDLPSSLFDTLAAAVSPLEIAASLETCGLSNSVVRQHLGHDDVFALAERLYRDVEFHPAPAANLRLKRRGGPPDLLRGVVFAAPTLMFSGAAIGLQSWLAWWTIPLALICGWAFSQFVAFVGFSRRSRDDGPGSAVAWGLLAALATCACVGLIGDAVLGGGWVAALFGASASAFMTASAELVVGEKERLIALMLVPGSVGSLIFITRVPFPLPFDAAVALGAVSVVATVTAALWHLPRQWWRVPPLSRSELPTAARYFVHGAACGVFVALFMVLEPAGAGGHTWPAVAGYPMILSLGAMEWQLRSLRSGARRALIASSTLAAFTRAARRLLARSVLSYVAVLATCTALVQALADARDVPVPVALVTAGAALALAFFLALAVAACGRVDLVLLAWAAGLVVYVGWDVFARLAWSSEALGDSRLAFCAAASVTALALATAAARVVVNPVCHG